MYSNSIIQKIAFFEYSKFGSIRKYNCTTNTYCIRFFSLSNAQSMLYILIEQGILFEMTSDCAKYIKQREEDVGLYLLLFSS